VTEAQRARRGPSPSLRTFARGTERRQVGNAGARLFERGPRGLVAREHHDALGAFVGLARRARALFDQGFEELAPAHPAAPVILDRFEAFEAYASAVDVGRSLPRQEHELAMAITPARARRDPRFALAAASLVLVGWPASFDASTLIDALDEPGEALREVLARELSASRRYPKELVRLACHHGSGDTLTLALRALARTRDPDAWLDVLIEGEPFLERVHVAALETLAKRAPSRDVAKMAREIARDLKAPPRRGRR